MTKPNKYRSTVSNATLSSLMGNVPTEILGADAVLAESVKVCDTLKPDDSTVEG